MLECVRSVFHTGSEGRKYGPRSPHYYLPKDIYNCESGNEDTGGGNENQDSNEQYDPDDVDSETYTCQACGKSFALKSSCQLHEKQRK